MGAFEDSINYPIQKHPVSSSNSFSLFHCNLSLACFYSCCSVQGCIGIVLYRVFFVFCTLCCPTTRKVLHLFLLTFQGFLATSCASLRTYFGQVSLNISSKVLQVFRFKFIESRERSFSRI